MDAENSNAKTEKLGLIPVAKIATVVPAKLWTEHRKNLDVLAQAKAAAATSKAAVLAAMAKALKLNDPDTLTFWSDAEKVVVVRRPENKKKQRTTVLRDLTAA